MNFEFKRMMELAGLTEIKVNEPGEISKLLALNINPFDYNDPLRYKNYQKLIDYLSKFVTRSDLFQIDPNIWEMILFYNYNEWVNNFKPNEEEIEAAPSEEEWNNTHNEINDNYNFNYFVRNFYVGDGEETRHENDARQNVQYFQNEYNVSSNIAKIMKKLVDEYMVVRYNM